MHVLRELTVGMGVPADARVDEAYGRRETTG